MTRWLLAAAALAALAARPALAQTVGPSPSSSGAISGAVPVAISIPSLGTSAPVVPLGQDDDGAMQAPTDPDTVGWFQPGPGVGAPGNALLDGHVDWAGRLRAFGLLRQLGPGDTIQITDENGNVLTYSVVWTELVAGDAAQPDLDRIFEEPTDTQEVTLITCGGAFDRSIHMYLSRVVVRAVRSG